MSRGAKRASRQQIESGQSCSLEALESRRLLSASSLSLDVPLASPMISSVTPSKGPPGRQAAYTPAQIRKAYGFDLVNGDGTGQTIAIIDAYHAATLQQDLLTFDSTYNLGSNTAFLQVAQPQGTPAVNTGWAQEITLDVEWAHAIAPKATILLVETNSNSFVDLMGGVDYAVSHGASVVSMSWGGAEFSSESSFDYHFANASGVTFVASAGDSGGVVEYPSVSPYVVGVGGTSLSLNSDNSYKSETGWSGSGGGISKYENKPAYQNSFVSGTKRATPDVGYVADTNTGVSVYYDGGWWIFGGTSVGAPQWASLISITNQQRGVAGSLSGYAQTLPALYNSPASDFHDITSGTAGRNRAGAGYDLITGRGSPMANHLIADLATADATGVISFSFTSPAGHQSAFSSARFLHDLLTVA